MDEQAKTDFDRARHRNIVALIFITPVFLLLILGYNFFLQFDAYRKSEGFSHCQFESVFDRRGYQKAPKFFELIGSRRVVRDYLANGAYEPLKSYVSKAHVDNPDLFAAVDKINNMPIEDLFVGNFVTETVRRLMIYSAKAENIDPASRGYFMDAQELQYINVFPDEILPNGQRVGYVALFPNPPPFASRDLKKKFNMALDKHYATILLYGPAEALFKIVRQNPKDLVADGNDSYRRFYDYDRITDADITYGFETKTVQLLRDKVMTLPESQRNAYWYNVAKLVHNIRIVDNHILDQAIRDTSDTTLGALHAAIDEVTYSAIPTDWRHRRVSFDFYSLNPFFRLTCIRPYRETDVKPVKVINFLLGR